MSDDKKEIYEKIADLLTVSQKAIEEAQALADEHALSFTWDLAYGMGGTYEGKGTEKYDYYGPPDKKYTERTEGEWVSSSSTC